MVSVSIAPEQVTAQLGRILSYEAFQNSEVLSRFLSFIVETTLAGNGKELKEYTIARGALLKGGDFNPQFDPIVRIHASRLRRLLVEYYQDEGKTAAIRISLPKGTYVPVFLVNESNAEIQEQPAQQPFSGRKKSTVAVLPFANISPDAAMVAYADGLGDHLSTELARYPELSVLSYFSCRHIITQVSDVKEIGAMLDADHILTGTVQIGNNQVRIRVQLILSATREHIWADSFTSEGTVANFFEIQDEIVRQVVSKTAGGYGAIARNLSKIPPSKNIDDLKIFDAIFWYYHFNNQVTEDIFLKAEAAMMTAVQAEPGYALGWAVLGEVLVGGYFMGFKSQHSNNQLEQALRYGKKAIKIDPACGHAYQTVALANIFLSNKLEALDAIHEWESILPVDPGIMGAMGSCLIFCGAYEKGFAMLDDSVHLNPYYQWWYNGAFSFYYFQKDEFENALYWAGKMNMPHVPWELLLKAACLVRMHAMAEAKHSFNQAMEMFPFLREHLDAYVGSFLQDGELVGKLCQSLHQAGGKQEKLKLGQ